MKRKFFFLTLILTVLSLTAAACGGVNPNGTDQQITASGAIAADRFDISPEVGGLVTEIFVQEGQTVRAGETLFHINDEILQGQKDQAQAAVDVADANITAAEEQLNAAKIQADRAEQGARMQDLQTQQSNPPLWDQPVPTEFNQPNWYYQKEEVLRAAQAELDAAWTAYDLETNNLESILSSIASSDFLEVEQTLSEARAHFIVTNQTLEEANRAQDNQTLRDMAQEAYDSALADLETAQRDYERALTTAAAEEIAESRAKVAVASARVENSQDLVDRYQTRALSLDVEAAQAAVAQAEAVLAQAKAGKNQAAAALSLLEIQIKKSNVTAPADGVVIFSSIQPGELVGPGSIVMSIAKLDTVELTVYIPEDVYGRIKLEQNVEVMVDSYPGKVYNGTVVYISDQAEFTPRNVQTVEGRKATVYAVKVQIPNPNHELKPGMPADVNFGEF
jgi:multidrug resistance efflux pump